MTTQQAEQNRRLAQRRRLNLIELRERITAVKPRSDDERLAVAECLHLLRLAESDPARTAIHG